MKLALFSHPSFLLSQSMPRFTLMLAAAFEARGHTVVIWAPKPRVYHWVPTSRLSKWAGYVDQYLLFPLWVRGQLKRQSADTLYVFCDQALGPWVPLVRHLPHIVHCHDLLALRSALDDIPENPTSVTGKIYQRYIRRGFRKASHFISVSHKTREDLHQFGGVTPVTSEVVYNGLNHAYAPMPRDKAMLVLQARGLPAQARGMLLHVGGGQWYKNTAGLVTLYAHYARQYPEPLPLWMVSPCPNSHIQAALKQVPLQGKVLFFSGLDNEVLQAAYSLARAFVFPSLAEGFGWPIAEAMACGCPVLTTGEAPMSEVGGNAARYLPRLRGDALIQHWAAHAAKALVELLTLEEGAHQQVVAQGLKEAARFNADVAIDEYLRIYGQVHALERARKNGNKKLPFPGITR